MDFQGDALKNCRVDDIGLEIGTVLAGRYRIVDYVSFGSMTILYKCNDSETGEMVLVKELAPITMVNRDLDRRSLVPKNRMCRDNLDKLRESFENEIEILVKLSEEQYGLQGCIPEYKGRFSENGTEYFAMAYYEGMDLQKRIANKEVLYFRPVARKIVKILNKVHRAGVIHRDIKLSNIFIKNNGDVTLLDFGSACKVEAEMNAGRYVSKGFSPPEVYDDNQTTRWVDCFTLGAVYYQMLTGNRPMQYDAKGEVYIPDIKDYVNIPWPLALVIMKLLALNPEKRLKKLWVVEMLL